MSKALLIRLGIPIALAASAVAMTGGVAQAAPVTQVASGSPTARNIYVSEAGCETAGALGYVFGAWTFYWCQPRTVPGDDELWYQLWTV